MNVEKITLPYQQATTKTETLNMLSLFSGCGGMDLGFEGGFSTLKSSVNQYVLPNFVDRKLNDYFVVLKKTKFRTCFANDILEEAKNSWIHYFSKQNRSTIFHTKSIVDLVKQHELDSSIFPNNIDLVIGGFPCQDFSISGKRNGFLSHKNHKGELINDNNATTETRGQLYMWMKKVIEIVQPNIFVAENVKGIVNFENVKEVIQKDFSSINSNGYIVLPPQVLHAADFGVPQSRERIFFIGIKKSALNKQALYELEKEHICEKYNPYPKPTHDYKHKGKNLKPFVTLKEVFQHLEEPEFSDDLSQKHYSKAKFMGTHCQGQTEIKLSDIAPTIRAEHHGNIEFRRLSKENGGQIHEELNKGLKERRLTVRECALIQTFPPDYEFVIENKHKKGSFLISPSKAYKIIGNAVPPLLAYHLARRIEHLWNLYFEK